MINIIYTLPLDFSTFISFLILNVKWYEISFLIRNEFENVILTILLDYMVYDIFLIIIHIFSLHFLWIVFNDYSEKILKRFHLLTIFFIYCFMLNSELLQFAILLWAVYSLHILHLYRVLFLWSLHYRRLLLVLD